MAVEDVGRGAARRVRAHGRRHLCILAKPLSALDPTRVPNYVAWRSLSCKNDAPRLEGPPQGLSHPQGGSPAEIISRRGCAVSRARLASSTRARLVVRPAPRRPARARAGRPGRDRRHAHRPRGDPLRRRHAGRARRPTLVRRADAGPRRGRRQVGHRRGRPGPRTRTSPGWRSSATEAIGCVGVWGGHGATPALALYGHTDVVPPGDLSAWRGATRSGCGSRTASPRAAGTCDMKGGCRRHPRCRFRRTPLGARTWPGPRRAHRQRPRRTVEWVRSRPCGAGTSPRPASVAEPTGGEIISANAGSLTFRLDVSGLSTHGSTRTRGVSAIEQFEHVHAALRELEARAQRDVRSRLRASRPAVAAVGRNGHRRRLGQHRARPARRRGPLRRSRRRDRRGRRRRLRDCRCGGLRCPPVAPGATRSRSPGPAVGSHQVGCRPDTRCTTRSPAASRA